MPVFGGELAGDQCGADIEMVVEAMGDPLTLNRVDAGAVNPCIGKPYYRGTRVIRSAREVNPKRRSKARNGVAYLVRFLWPCVATAGRGSSHHAILLRPMRSFLNIGTSDN
jgi:hypothetical protein